MCTARAVTGGGQPRPASRWVPVPARSHGAPASPAPLSQTLPRLPRRNKPILRGDETGSLSAIFVPAGPRAGSDGPEAEAGGAAPVAALPVRGQRQPESSERSMGPGRQKRRARPAGPREQGGPG